MDTTGCTTWCNNKLRRVILTVYVGIILVVAEGTSCTQENAKVPNNAHILRFTPSQFIIYECDSGYEFNDTNVGIQWCHGSDHQWTGERGTCKLSSTPAQTPAKKAAALVQPQPFTIRRRRPGGAALEPDKCRSSPCQNGGSCDASEDPYGWGYYCICKRNFGGRLCQISDPCRTAPCPPKTVECFRSITKDSGRFCYDKAWNIVADP